MLSYLSAMVWRCSQESCTRKFRNRSALLYHYQKTHTECEVLKCPDCTEVFEKEAANQFLFHVDCHDNLRCSSCYNVLTEDHSCDPWPCGFPSCKHLFPKRSLLVQHFQQAHSSGKPFSCPDCGFSTSSSTEFVCHVDNHQELSECDKCKHAEYSFEHIARCSPQETKY